MTLAQLKGYFSKWLVLTREQREFIQTLLMSDKFTVVEIVELIDSWIDEMEPMPMREVKPK